MMEQKLPDCFESYLSFLETRGRQPSTIKRYRYDLEDFHRWLKLASSQQVNFDTIKALTTEELERYIDFLLTSRRYSERTIKRIITVINQLYRFYRSIGRLAFNPVSELSINTTESVEFKTEHFISTKEQERLISSVSSPDGLSDNQLKTRHLLIERNISIIQLFLQYGLSLRELVSLNMKDIHFEQNELEIQNMETKRIVKIKPEHKKQLYNYFKTIPVAVRPRLHSQDPFFVAFDFQRETYRWDYDYEKPKRLTEIAVQKMIRQEVARAGLRKGISAQHMRRTYVKDLITQHASEEDIKQRLGLKSSLTLKRYYNYVNSEQQYSS
ncbi:tyrosine-type recombinase/integrase [Pseudalkalibacillus caeni]|uniref:Integrase n=1 Tax=Exobacillus caeni TaxID=2574798 RepID=A0A5R9F1W2_9BACL|nr:tyrosine-type recombinase/integrase [Pseudalkalibacillus caeni]TLS37622.1 integrase [Pseudalkalibacillus caeni]